MKGLKKLKHQDFDCEEANSSRDSAKAIDFNNNSEIYIGRTSRKRSETIFIDDDISSAFQKVNLGLQIKITEFERSRPEKFVPSLSIIHEDSEMTDFSKEVKPTFFDSKNFSDFDF